MSITDELRKEARAIQTFTCMAEQANRLLDISDRIDAEHERQLEVLYRDMSDAEYVKLPVDADGEPIHIGDVMERGKACGYVIALMLSEYPKKWGGGLHWGVQLEGEQAPTALDLTFHHYHAPTVEDLLFSYGQSCIRISDEAETDAAKQTMLAKLREEYATKLHLANDGKEQ